MWRSLVCGITSWSGVTGGFHPIDKRATELFELHEPGLLCRHDIIEFIQHLILMRQACLQFNEAIVTHRGPLLADSYSGRIHATLPEPIMSLLRFEDISLEFGDQLILREAEFAIESGERVCLIGRNGAGKSTTLKLITGALEPDRGDLAALEELVDDVGRRFTDRWNGVLAALTAYAEPVDDAFRVHGEQVIHNTAPELRDAARPSGAKHRFLGPLVRDEALVDAVGSWRREADTPLVYVALGTFLSLRADVLERVASALRRVGARAAIATGSTDPSELGPVPSEWIVAPTLPQVALLADADLAIHHGGNNSVQESLVAGARQLVLPFSTDQFDGAAAVERGLAGVALDPNHASRPLIAGAVRGLLRNPPTAPARIGERLRRDPGPEIAYAAMADLQAQPRYAQGVDFGRVAAAANR